MERVGFPWPLESWQLSDDRALLPCAAAGENGSSSHRGPSPAVSAVALRSELSSQGEDGGVCGIVESTATGLKSRCGSRSARFPDTPGELGAERPRGGSDVRAFVTGDNRSSGELGPSVMARPRRWQAGRGSSYL